MAGLEAVAELLVKLGFAQRAVGMTSRAAHLLAFDAAAREVDTDLVPPRGARGPRLIIRVGLDRDPAHQVLDVGTLDKGIGVLGEASAPRDHRRRHCELHAELAFQPRLWPMAAQDQG